MEPTRKNQQAQNDGARYDYSHLREPSKKDHWYAAPSGGKAAPPPPQSASPAPSVPTQAANQAVPPVNTPTAPPAAASSPARQRINKKQKRRASGMPENWAWVVIASALLGVTIVGSILLVVVVRYAVRDSGDQALAVAPEIEPTSIIYSDEEEIVGGALDGNSLEIQNRAWSGDERFTILVMGLDKRPSETGSTFRTDSMILISLDPKTNSIGMLSIPRDLYVEVPNEGLHRVNSGYVLGELEQDGGGPRKAMQTVQYNFGIRVHEYVTVDFQTFIAIVNAVGGVEVDVENTIVDYTYPTMDYGTEVFRLEAGIQQLDGETALKFARSRHSSDDIVRAGRQQQVIYAIRDQILSLDMLDDLIVQAPTLYTELRNGIDTGLSLDQIIELALWAQSVPLSNINSAVVSREYLFGYQTPGGASVLVPRRSSLGELMVEVFGADYNQ